MSWEIWQANSQANWKVILWAGLLELLQESNLECTWVREMECEWAQTLGCSQVGNLANCQEILQVNEEGDSEDQLQGDSLEIP